MFKFNKIPHLLVLLGILPLVLSCEEVIDLELNNPDQQRIVVEGRITTVYGPQQLRLTQTLSYFEHEPAPILQDIEAKIVEEGTGREFPLTLADDSTGYYRTEDMAGKVGETYRLIIEKGEDTYEAVTFLDTVPDIDSISFEYSLQQFFGVRFGQYSVKISTFEPAPEGDLYTAIIYLNDTLYTEEVGQNLYFDDFGINNTYVSEIELFSFAQEEIYLDTNTVRIEMYSMSEEEFNFLIGLFNESYGNGSIFSGPPANIPTNIINISGGIDGCGFFGASDKTVIEGTFLKEHDESTNNPFFE